MALPGNIKIIKLTNIAYSKLPLDDVFIVVFLIYRNCFLRQNNLQTKFMVHISIFRTLIRTFPESTEWNDCGSKVIPLYTVREV